MPRSPFLTACALVALPLGLSAREAPNFTGPLVTPAVNTLPAGLFNIEPYLIHSNARGNYGDDLHRREAAIKTRQWQIAVPITYGLTNDTGVQVLLTASRTTGGGQHTDGLRMGDTTLRVNHRLKAPAADGTGLVLGVAVAQRFATGTYHGLDANPLNATGNGAARTTFVLGGQQLHWLGNGHALRWRSQLGWSPSPGRITVRDGSVYGTAKGFRGTARPGHAWNATFAAEYVLDNRWVLVAEAIWNRFDSVKVKGHTAPGHAARHVSPAGHDIGLAPAVEYHFSPTIGLIAGVQFTVAGRNATDYVAPQAALNMVF